MSAHLPEYLARVVGPVRPASPAPRGAREIAAAVRRRAAQESRRVPR